MKHQLQEELDRMVAVLRKIYLPEQIILYGSAARGDGGPDSDLDLVLIKKTSLRFYDRIGDVLKLLRPKEAVDILVYTPEEYNRMKGENWFVGEEIAKKGRVLYSQS